MAATVNGFIHSSVLISVSYFVASCSQELSRVFQAYAVSQSFNCVSNDYKRQLRLRSIGFSKSVLTRVLYPWALISVLTWSNEKDGERDRGRERKGASGQVSQNNNTCASHWYHCCHYKTQKAFWVAFPATQVSDYSGCGVWTRISRQWPVGSIKTRKPFVVYLELLAKEKYAVSGQLMIC